jgi:hypothetical protein
MDKMAQVRFSFRFDRRAPSSNKKKKKQNTTARAAAAATGTAAPAGTRSTSCGPALPERKRLPSFGLLHAHLCRFASCPPPAGTMPLAPAYAVLAAAFRTKSRISGFRRNSKSSPSSPSLSPRPS